MPSFPYLVTSMMSSLYKAILLLIQSSHYKLIPVFTPGRAGGGGTPILGHGREVLWWWPSFLRFSIRLGALFSILKPLKQLGSIWLAPHCVDIQSNWPLFPNFQSNWPPFLNPVRSDWVHFSSLCWASLPKYLLSTPPRVFTYQAIILPLKMFCMYYQQSRDNIIMSFW